MADSFISTFDRIELPKWGFFLDSDNVVLIWRYISIVIVIVIVIAFVIFIVFA